MFNIGPIDTKLQIFYNLNVLFLTMLVSCRLSHKKNRIKKTDSYPAPLDLKLCNGLKLEKVGLTFSSFNAMPAKTTQKLLSKKEVCVTRTIAIPLITSVLSRSQISLDGGARMESATCMSAIQSHGTGHNNAAEAEMLL